MVTTVLRPTDRQVADIQERTCTHCGAHTLFYPSDPQGNWYRCSQCGAYA